MLEAIPLFAVMPSVKSVDPTGLKRSSNDQSQSPVPVGRV